MIVLDTNVVSETMRPEPDTNVLGWLDERSPVSLFLTSVTEAEIRFGLARLPAGKRRNRLSAAANQMFDVHFRGRVLPFDRDAADDYASIAAHRCAIGRPIAQLDCQIAAIVRARGAALATRNVADFAELGLELINPWTAA